VCGVVYAAIIRGRSRRGRRRGRCKSGDDVAGLRARGGPRRPVRASAERVGDEPKPPWCPAIDVAEMWEDGGVGGEG